MSKQLRVICAWCGKIMREGAEPASHGICDECFRKQDQGGDVQQISMQIEVIEHREHDSLIMLRCVNHVTRRDSVLWLSAPFKQIQDLRVGQELRVTVDAI